MEDKSIAILIDADNIASKYIRTIIDEATNYGVITYKRIYGDWTTPNMKSWKDVLLEYSINPIQQYSYTTGKNATDSAMIIDAMDILYTGHVDGFCLVSSDSDFTKLASRLKEAGKTVIGMGKQQTPKAFVAACSIFRYIDILSGEKSSHHDETRSRVSDDSTITNERVIKRSIQAIIEENANVEGWTLASVIGLQMQKKFPDFDCRNYGCKKMIDLLKKLNFETKVSDKTTYLVR